jgi:hypothetical protein
VGCKVGSCSNPCAVYQGAILIDSLGVDLPSVSSFPSQLPAETQSSKEVSS